MNVIRNELWNLESGARIVSIDGYPVGPPLDKVTANLIVM